MRIATAAVFASIVAVAGCCCPMMKPPAKTAADEEAEIRKVMASSWWTRQPTSEQVNGLVRQIMALDRDWMLFVDSDGKTANTTLFAATNGGDTGIFAPVGMGEKTVYVLFRANATRYTAARDLAKAVGP